MRLAAPPRLVAALAGPPLSLLARSWRMEASGEERWLALADHARPYVILAWHDALVPLLWRHRDRQVRIVVSEALEGRYLAAYARRLGYREARGSSTRGGVRALLGVVRELKAGGAAAFTADGPRGPRRELKSGVLLAAQRGAASIVPMHAGADRAWRLRTWDRMLVPKLGARVRIAYGEPFMVEPGDSGIVAARRRAEREMAHVVHEVGWDDAATGTD